MKFYNKETRTEAGIFYRGDDWGIEKPNDWDNGKGNFTDQPPPEETIQYGVPCDWDEESGSWKLDETSDQFKNLSAEKRLAEYEKQGITTDKLIVALWEKVVENRPETATELQTAREAIKTLIPKG